MTKIKIINAPSGRDLMENIEWSPYYKVAMKMLHKRGIDNSNIADLFECFHEIAKIANKLERGEK